MATSVVTVSLKNMKFNEHKIKATHYAGQLEEWLRNRKELDWGGSPCYGCSGAATFTQFVSQDGSPTVYCFNDVVISNWSESGNCGNYDLDSFFKREVIFNSTVNSGYISQVEANITVSWLELGQPKSVITNTVFSVPEQ